MTVRICPDLASYFFGNLFEVEIANSVLSGNPAAVKLLDDLLLKTKEGHIHLGLQLISFLDLDTGAFVSVLQKNVARPSMVSFFVSSGHRFFGGQTLICVPFQFCIGEIQVAGDYLVYRHTYKEPVITQKEIGDIANNATAEEILKMRILMKSRDGYRSIEGMSYVGLTKRSWQQRYLEHVESAMKKSSSIKFQEAIKKMQGRKVLHVHDVSAFGLTKEAATIYEKKLIRRSTLYPMGLNMKVG